MLILHKLLCLTHYNKFTCSQDPRIQKIKEYIHENYTAQVPVDDLAGLTGLNPVYLGSLFKKHNDCSIKEYINRVRVNVSEDLLSAGGYTVSEAAQRCGFNDIFYFSKVFKKYKGYPPSDVLRRT
jgi:YesN/AraC family two-component response regulator